MFKVDLRRLILALCLFSVLLSLAAGLIASYVVQRNLLLANTLESNRVYAEKLATLSGELLQNVHLEVAYIAKRDPGWKANPQGLSERLEQIHAQSDRFNSVLAVGPDGIVRAQAPASLGLLGRRISSDHAKQALTRRQPTLSEPYLSVTGRWLITQLVPVFTEEGEYDGYVAGNLYLHESNALNTLLSIHFFENGTYSYVVDQNGILIYHPMTESIGKKVAGNRVIDAVTRGKSGDSRVVNTKHTEMVAGYASVPLSGWGVVVQRPEALVLGQLSGLTRHTLINASPLVVMTLLIVFLLSSQIVKPLRAMAQVARAMDDSKTAERLRHLKCWYLEATLLRRALLSGLWAMNHKIRNLKQESATDALSGLLNRRGLQVAIEQFTADGTPTSVIVLDIDGFKSINDEHGHPAGDAVIRMVAERMRRRCRSADIAARSGGEEFVILLPDTHVSEAFQMAERLREDIAEVTSMGPVAVTVSCGVANWPTHASDLASAWRLADQALYDAKRNGRNQSMMTRAEHAEPGANSRIM